MSLDENIVVPDDLRLKLTGIVPDGKDFLRIQLFNELISTIPKDPEVRMLMYHAELRPGTEVPWHFHNGPLMIIMLQGDVILQFEHEAFYYTAGDVFVEPVGIVHRSYSPHPEIPMAGIGIQLTPPDREHIVNLPKGPTDAKPLTAPRGPLLPRPRISEILANT